MVVVVVVNVEFKVTLHKKSVTGTPLATEQNTAF